MNDIFDKIIATYPKDYKTNYTVAFHNNKAMTDLLMTLGVSEKEIQEATKNALENWFVNGPDDKPKVSIICQKKALEG